jgi:Neuraminidase (sialidase)
MLFATSSAQAAAPTPSFTAPVRLGFPNGDDWEPSIAADALGNVFVLWSHYVGFDAGSSGDPDPTCLDCASPHSVLQVSNDGGVAFGNPRALTPTATARQDDPQIVVDRGDGKTVYAAFMQNNKSSEYVARSDDSGLHWTPVLTEDLQRGTDKDILAARDGNVYLLYHTQQKIFVSVSHDRGETWSRQNPLKSTTNSEWGVSYASGGAVAPDGTVYFALNGVRRPGQAKGTINLYVIKSSDGGETWTTSPVDVSQAAPDCGCEGYAYWSAQMALDVDAAGTVYVLWNANSTKGGPQRMFFARSSDGARTWSPKADVSLASQGSNNLFPAIVAGGANDVRIAWQDDRNGFDSGTSPDARWNVYYRSSNDGGTTWSNEAQLSSYVAGYGYDYPEGYLQPYGDYFELDITNDDKTVAIWGEGFSWTGPGNIWFAREQ